MKTEKEIRDQLKESSKKFDEYGRKPSTIFENAPRALIQTQMETWERCLQWVLGLENE